MFGRRTGEVVGRMLGEVTECREGGASHDEIRAALGAQGTWSGPIAVPTSSGAVIRGNMRVSGLHDSSGNRIGFVGSIRDMTAFYHLEEQYRQAVKLESVGRLAGGIAHDFNNLLTVINGRCHLALSQLLPGSPVRSDIEEILVAGERAAALTRQLLAFSRKQFLEPKVLDLNGLVQQVENLLRRLVEESIAVVARLDPALGNVKADAVQMEQVILNLAVNARDAMPQGGTLLIETANVELDADYAGRHADVEPGPYVMLAISDTGQGMDETTRQRIFEPFFTTKEVGKGTGLGLSTVYGIVKQSGGHIWVYSEVGRGSTFKVYLPRASGSQEQPAAAKHGRIGGKGERILVVEDQPDVRGLAATLLTVQGYTVMQAATVAEAERIASRGDAIHLLLTDVVMPDATGPQLAARLAGYQPDMKVLYMSGYTDNAMVHHGVSGPGVAFLEKPFTPDRLARKIREVLESA